MNDGRKKVPMV